MPIIPRRSSTRVQMTAVTFDEARAHVAAVASRNRDWILRGSDLRVNPNGTVRLGEHGDHAFSDLGFSQFCTKLRVPTDFVRNSPVEGPASKKAILEHWLSVADGKTFFVRTRELEQPDPDTGAKGLVRAVLGERYGVLDNVDILDMLRSYIERHDLIVNLGNYTEASHTLHMRLLRRDKYTVGTLPDGSPDEHQVGFHLVNSETGVSPLIGDALVFRQVCTNGLVALLEEDHLLEQKHSAIDRADIRVRLASAMEASLVRGEELLSKLGEARSMTLVNPTRDMQRLLKANRATEDFIEMAEKEYDAAPDPSRFGVIQAITAAARRLPQDQRLSMEHVAGAFLLAA